MKGLCEICGQEKERVHINKKSRLAICETCYARGRPWYKNPRSPEYRKKYRRTHRQIWNVAKKRNYDRGSVNLRNADRHYTKEERQKIISPDCPRDRVLAQELGRSVRAIQIQRARLSKKVRVEKESVGGDLKAKAANPLMIYLSGLGLKSQGRTRS